MEEGKIVIGVKQDQSEFDKNNKTLQKKMDTAETKKIKIEVDESNIESVKKRIDELYEKASQPTSIKGAKVSGTWNLSDEETAEYNRLLEIQTELEAKTTEQASAQREVEKVVQKTNSDYDEQDARIGKMQDELISMVDTYKRMQKGDIITEDDIQDAEELKQKIIDTSNELSTLTGKKVSIKGITDISNETDSIDIKINNISSALTGVIRKVGRWALAVFSIRSAYSLVRNAVSVLAGDNAQLGADIDYMKESLAYALEPVVIRIVDWAKQLMVAVGYVIKAITGKNIFAKTDKGIKSASNNAKKLNKELNKTTTSFDEINTLQEPSSTDSSSGAGVTTPSFSLGQEVENYQPPDWLKFIVDNKDIILDVIAGIAGGLAAWKLGFSGLQSLGIGLAITGIVMTIQSLIKYLKDPSWKNFGGVVSGIGLTLVGVGIATGNLPLIVIGAITTILGIVIKNWEKIKETLQGGIDWLKSKSDWIKEHFGSVIGGIYDAFVDSLQIMHDQFSMFVTNLKSIFDGIIKFIKGVFTGNWKEAFEGLKQIVVGIFNIIGNTIVTAMNLAINIVKGIFLGIVGFFQGIVNSVLNLFGLIGTKAGDVISGAFIAVVNAVLGAIESILNFPIRAINRLIKTINKVPGINLGTLRTFNLPRLAKGGILNNPGKGVFTGSAIAGEAGPEAYIPLNDATLDKLGSAIAKHAVFNNMIVNKMNGRTISRELQRISNEEEFAMNS